MNSELQSFFSQTISSLYGIDVQELAFEVPPKKEFGDFSFGAFQLAKELRKSPQEIANQLFIALGENTADFIEELKLVGPYINIYLKKDMIFSQFLNYLIDKEKETEKKGTVIIDYIGANVGKPLHIGHMCTPNIGQMLINLHKKLGYEVIGDSHIGDWGIIFGRLIWAWKNSGQFLNAIFTSEEFFYYQSQERFGFKFNNIEEIFSDLLSKEGADFLMRLYQKSFKVIDESEHEKIEEEIRNEFKLLSEGEKNAVELWKKFTATSIESMNVQLSRLNVHPDYNIGESFYEGIGLPKIENYPDLKDDMKTIVEELIEKKIATKNEDGSVGVVFAEELKIPSCILQKRDGTHGYLASDLATIKYRMQNWAPDKIVYSVDVRQQLHLKQVFTVAEMVGWLEIGRKGKEKTELFHAYNGFIALKDGAMSTRKGRIVKLSDLLDEAEKRAGDIITEKRSDIGDNEKKMLSKIVGMGAIKYGYLKKSRETDTIFDWDEFLTFEGNSGPYIQYAYVRAQNILEKAGKRGELIKETEIIYEQESSLIQKIFQYRQALDESEKSYAPHVLAKYIYELTKEFNSFYTVVPVNSEENIGMKNFRISLVEEFCFTLKDALGILAIDVPDKM